MGDYASLVRAAIEMLGVFGSLREKDVAAQRILRTRFLGALDDADLGPAIVPLQVPTHSREAG